MVRKNISTIREPSLGEILRVNQRGFGYLNPEVIYRNHRFRSMYRCLCKRC